VLASLLDIARAVAPHSQGLAARSLLMLLIRIALRSRSARRGAPDLGLVIIIARIAFWIGGLICGFALILTALDLHSGGRMTFADAAYQAALAVSTLGLSGAQATGWARVAVAAAGLSGFTVVTLSTAVLVSLKAEVRRRDTFTTWLFARGFWQSVTLQIGGPPLTSEHSADLLRRAEIWLVELLLAATHTPLVLLIHSPRVRPCWIETWLALDQWAAELAPSAQQAAYLSVSQNVRSALHIFVDGLQLDATLASTGAPEPDRARRAAR
jgi:hypothetical protein